MNHDHVDQIFRVRQVRRISQRLGKSEPVNAAGSQGLTSLFHRRSISVEHVNNVTPGVAESRGRVQLDGPELDNQAARNIGNGGRFSSFCKNHWAKGKGQTKEVAQCGSIHRPIVCGDGCCVNGTPAQNSLLISSPDPLRLGQGQLIAGSLTVVTYQ